MSSRTKEIKANWEKVNNLLQGANFECIDNDLDIVLRTADNRTIVVSSYFECLTNVSGKSRILSVYRMSDGMKTNQKIN